MKNDNVAFFVESEQIVVDDSSSVTDCEQLSRNTNRNKPGRTPRNSMRKKIECWSPVSCAMISAAQFCPRAIINYILLGNKRPPESLVLDVRKHLLCLGWKIECKRYRDTYIFRYTSPDNTKIYLSLRQLCHDLNDKLSKNCLTGLHDYFTNHTKECFGTKQPRKRKREDDLLQSPFEVLSHSSGTRYEVETVKESKLRHQKIEKGNRLTAAQQSMETVGQKHVIPTLSNCNQEPVIPTSSSCNAEPVIPTSSNCNPRSLSSWLIDNNAVPPGAKVYYRGSKKRPELTTGRIKRDGIVCDCCQNIFNLSAFEAHAGSTKHRPSANILLEDGRSLFDCQIQTLGDKKIRRVERKPRKNIKEHQHQNDDHDSICSVCRDAGDLILCDQCPSTFHKTCLGLEEVPDGKWFCPSCCCGICGQNEFKDIRESKDASILGCDQCQHRYHVGCLRDKVAAKLERKNPKDNWFCSDKCEYIFLGLQKLLRKPIVVGSGNLTWTLMKSVEPNSCDREVLLENHRKLSNALKVMHECFKPLKDAYTGRDLIEDLIFSRGSEIKRLDFRGFYTILLERNKEVITVASVRVFGERVAEAPLIATRFQYRRLGMCRILMDELEKQLMNLGIERLMLPAAVPALHTWTKGFGFSQLTNYERVQFLDHHLVEFQGTNMCQKVLKKSLKTQENLGDLVVTDEPINKF